MLTLYTKNNCSFCMMAKGLLKNNDIAFEEINVEQDQSAFDFILSEGHRTMPQIYRDGELFVEGGFQGLQAMGAQAIKESVEGIDTSLLGDI